MKEKSLENLVKKCKTILGVDVDELIILHAIKSVIAEKGASVFENYDAIITKIDQKLGSPGLSAKVVSDTTKEESGDNTMDEALKKLIPNSGATLPPPDKKVGNGKDLIKLELNGKGKGKCEIRLVPPDYNIDGGFNFCKNKGYDDGEILKLLIEEAPKNQQIKGNKEIYDKVFAQIRAKNDDIIKTAISTHADEQKLIESMRAASVVVDTVSDAALKALKSASPTPGNPDEGWVETSDDIINGYKFKALRDSYEQAENGETVTKLEVSFANGETVTLKFYKGIQTNDPKFKLEVQLSNGLKKLPRGSMEHMLMERAISAAFNQYMNSIKSGTEQDFTIIGNKLKEYFDNENSYEAKNRIATSPIGPGVGSSGDPNKNEDDW